MPAGSQLRWEVSKGFLVESAQPKWAVQNEKEKQTNPVFHCACGCNCSLSGSSINSFRLRKKLVGTSMFILPPSSIHGHLFKHPTCSFCTKSYSTTEPPNWIILWYRWQQLEQEPRKPAGMMRLFLQNLFLQFSVLSAGGKELERVLERRLQDHMQPEGLQLSLQKDTHMDHVYVFGKRYDQPSHITLVSRLCWNT